MRTRKLAAAAIAAGVIALTACAPPTADNTAPTANEETGTVRVWLFSEVNQDPKETVVNEAVKEFEAAHEGVTVDVQYIAVDTRSERFRAAFNDPSSAPDVAEIGNTDLAGYVAAGGLADLTADIKAWEEGKDLDPAVLSTTEIGGVNYAVPWYIGVRALYYRTDVFTELGLEPPTSMAELEETARKIRAAKPELVGIATGGNAQFSFLPYLWANGGEIATVDGDTWTATLDTAAARDGLTAYSRLLSDDICPPQTCAEWGGNASVQQFIAGGAGMTIGGDFNRKAVEESEMADKYAVVPLPGVEDGSVAPAFAGGNHLTVFKSSERRGLAMQFVELLAGKTYQQKMFDAMGNLPTFSDVQSEAASSVPALEPFMKTISAGTKFVPVTPAWNEIDAQGLLLGMVQSVVTGAASVDDATTSATTAMNTVFAGQ